MSAMSLSDPQTKLIDDRTGEEVVTRDGPDRRHRLCRCATCRVVERCTETNDFWVVKGKRGLLCERCWTRHLVRPDRYDLERTE